MTNRYYIAAMNHYRLRRYKMYQFMNQLKDAYNNEYKDSIANGTAPELTRIVTNRYDESTLNDKVYALSEMGAALFNLL